MSDRQPTQNEVYHAAHVLYEMHHTFGVGEANPVFFSTFHGHFAPGKTEDSARRQWERLKQTLDAMGAPVERQRTGRKVGLVLGDEARAFALQQLEQLTESAEADPGDRFLRVALSDVAPVEGWEPDPEELARMQESILSCPIGLIHPVLLVGDAAPYRLGLGRMRLAACAALGLKTVLARLVSEWDPIIELDEDHVRRHYGEADLQDLRERRDERVRALRGQGKSNRQIASDLGVCEATVRRCSGASGDAPERCRGSDDKSYPSGRLKPAQLEDRRREVKRLREDEKLSTRAIAERVGISVGTVHSDLSAEPRPEAPQGPAWYEIDVEQAPLMRCVAAMERGVVELAAGLRAGTATLKRARQLQGICFAVGRRVRAVSPNGDWQASVS